MRQDYVAEIEIPSGVTLNIGKGVITVQGDKGSVERRFKAPTVSIETKDGALHIEAKKSTLREKKKVFTLESHVKNMIEGVTKGHSYKLKVCSGHFPMNVSVKNGVLEVKNFLGEAVPRRLKIKDGADVKLNGDIIEVTSHSLELAGSQASDIEQLTRITNRDRRIFQDGIYIIEKRGRPIA